MYTRRFLRPEYARSEIADSAWGEIVPRARPRPGYIPTYLIQRIFVHAKRFFSEVYHIAGF